MYNVYCRYSKNRWREYIAPDNNLLWHEIKNVSDKIKVFFFPKVMFITNSIFCILLYAMKNNIKNMIMYYIILYRYYPGILK